MILHILAHACPTKQGCHGNLQNGAGKKSKREAETLTGLSLARAHAASGIPCPCARSAHSLATHEGRDDQKTDRERVGSPNDE